MTDVGNNGKEEGLNHAVIETNEKSILSSNEPIPCFCRAVKNMELARLKKFENV